VKQYYIVITYIKDIVKDMILVPIGYNWLQYPT